MIITRLRGGLGNQLFQYACGRAFSLQSGDTLKLDVEGYDAARNKGTDTPRDYSLSHFNIQEIIATTKEIHDLKYPFGIVSKAWRFASIKIFRRFNMGFYPGLSKRVSGKKDFYLDGFWQSAKYFDSIEPIIRKDITLKKPFSPNAARIIEMMKGSQAKGMATVSIHVRRGDVARDAKTNPYYGICTPQYYADAIEYISSRSTQNPSMKGLRLFVFSDDSGWVRQNIKLPEGSLFVSDNKLPDYEELVLMSMCDHNIIANSSFSWWGAWLNSSKDKVIVAPKEWITRGKKNHKDTVPPTWIRL